LSTLKRLVAEFVENPSEEEINEATPMAILKRDRIIEREGTAGGTRMLLDYLAQLIAEQIGNNRVERFTFMDYEHKKRHVAEANAPTSHDYFNGYPEKCQVVNITIFYQGGNI